jgi:UDP-N-acetylmuramoylalanine--D-glutamate ligase
MSGRLLVLGGKESGSGAALLARDKGWDVLVSDAGALVSPYKEQLQHSGIQVEEGGHVRALQWGAELVVKSPGIPDQSPAVAELAQRGIPVISEIEWAASHSRAVIVGITGSNGKTTTTALTGHVFKRAGLDVVVAGNIGNSYSAAVRERDPEYAVLEISSFQLDNILHFRPHVGMLLNITPDHLDRYQYQMDAYAAAKFRIAENQQPGDYFLYCADDPETSSRLERANIASALMPFGMKGPRDAGAWVEDQQLIINTPKNQLRMSIYDLALQGRHNLYNSMAAGIAASVLGISQENIRESLMDFRALEHRLENAGAVKGVTYINDSKATNINSAWYALDSTEGPVIWIAGGVDKGNDYSVLTDLVRSRVKAIICLGVDNRKLHEAFSHHVDVMINTRDMLDAVRMAQQLANPGDTVLLSPACASFDLFRNYEDRGAQFKRAVRSL